jgi:hypothetical protein
VKPLFLLERDLLFDESFPYPAFEDSDLGWRLQRAGFELYYHPEARVLHARQFRLEDFTGRMRRVGESAAILRRVNPEFPLDERAFDRSPSRAKSALLRLAGPVVAATGPDRYAFRYFDDRVSRAYREGRRRAAS